MSNDSYRIGGRELPTDRQTDDATPPDVFVITVVEGPDAGLRQTIDPASPARILVGKSVTSSLRLADTEVSRRHASIRPEGNILVLSDLGSTNGTRVNGVAIREATLSGGEAIRVGKTVLSVSRGAPAFAPLTEEKSFGRLIGASRAMRRLYPILHRLAANDLPILIEGETGSGKELCAEEIHAHSPRAGRPFVTLSCHTLAAGSLEDKLFGTDGEEGLFAQAAGGTLYIDEVAALPSGLQRHLATLLDKPLEARLIFGTRRDLDRDVTEGLFREELLAKLAPSRIDLPPLRDREGDVEMLARSFWSSVAAGEAAAATGNPADLPVDFLARFHRYRWPGNVRELSAAVCSRFNMGELGRWRAARQPGDAEDFMRAVVDRELPLAEGRQLVVDEFERRYVDHMLSRHGNSRDAAKASGVGIRYFQILRARMEL